MKRSITAIALGSALALGAAAAPVAVAQEKQDAKQQQAKQQEATNQRQELREIAKLEDPAAKVAALEGFIAKYPEGQFAPVAHQQLVGALAEAKAPAPKLIAAAETALAKVNNPFAKGMLQNSVAMTLADRGEELDRALDYAQKALAAIPEGDDFKEMRANVRDTLGWVLVKRGDTAKAIEELNAAVAVIPTSQELLYHLGAAHEKAGNAEKAIEYYVKSETVFLGKNEMAKEPLRALYAKKHGSIEGLEAKLAAAREASRKEVVFETRRWEKPAPAWELKDVAGKPVKLADFKGKVVVMDFWGTWCPPCRAELPHFQALYEKYKDRGVVFLGMNWEQPGEAAERMKLVTDFMATNKYSFPVVIDHERVAVEAYDIPGFPTVFLIDGTGTIRYRNVGYEEGVDQILEAQLESMLK